MKNLSIALSIVCLSLSYFTYRTINENQTLKLENVIYFAENRILKDEVFAWERKPSYEDGKRETIIRMSSPDNAETYKAGWDDAMTLANGGYSEGYHAAIFQFGYQKPNYQRYLAPEPKNGSTAKVGLK